MSSQAIIKMKLLVVSDFGVLNYQVLPLGLAYNQFPNGTLLISSVDKSSQGSYTCTAQNGVRSAISKTINVTVNGKSGKKYDPAVLVSSNWQF